MKVAHVEASNVVPSLMASWLSKNVTKKVTGKPPKSDLLQNLPEGNDSSLEKLFESLNLKGIQS